MTLLITPLLDLPHSPTDPHQIPFNLNVSSTLATFIYSLHYRLAEMENKSFFTGIYTPSLEIKLVFGVLFFFGPAADILRQSFTVVRH